MNLGEEKPDNRKFSAAREQSYNLVSRFNHCDVMFYRLPLEIHQKGKFSDQKTSTNNWNLGVRIQWPNVTNRLPSISTRTDEIPAIRSKHSTSTQKILTDGTSDRI